MLDAKANGCSCEIPLLFKNCKISSGSVIIVPPRPWMRPTLGFQLLNDPQNFKLMHYREPDPVDKA